VDVHIGDIGRGVSVRANGVRAKHVAPRVSSRAELSCRSKCDPDINVEWRGQPDHHPSIEFGSSFPGRNRTTSIPKASSD